MPYILLLILIAILGGPWFVAIALALTGVWFLIAWAIIGMAGLAILVGIFLLGSWCLAYYGLFAGKPKPAFGALLKSQFKAQNQVEDRIWKDDMHYMVEIEGRTNYFRTLKEARLARDSGIVT